MPPAPPHRPEALQEYRTKRDFASTPEPRGNVAHPSASELRFVVQRHRARRTHYDFRLEVDGVLASWALPKGPTLDPAVRTLAVRVEDHPAEYRDFEGVIPGGQYGAGDVIVWDRGTYDTAGGEDPSAAIANGELHFDLHGEKLAGRFVLVRTRRDDDGREQWLLLHKRDAFAKRGWRPDDYPRSVKSGRTNEEVAAQPDAMWRSDLPVEQAEVAVTHRAVGRHSSEPTASVAVEQAQLVALEELGNEGQWEIQGRVLKLTNLDKVLVPGRGHEPTYTKRDLVRYYVTIAPVILPYLVDRPVNLHRFPHGIGRPGFWHKRVPNYAPRWLERWHYEDARPGETDSYAVIDSVPALAWMANYAALELHPWTSRIPDVHQPTWALIDIDPGESTTFEQVLVLTRLFRSGLDHLGVLGLPKLTGKRGIHIWIPVAPGYTFDDTRTWVETLSRAVGATAPELVSWTWAKRSRQGLARLDYTQNAINKTLVAPYSIRAAPGAPVSAPIEWDELDDAGLRSDRWTARTIVDRVAERGDPFLRLLDEPQHLPAL